MSLTGSVLPVVHHTVTFRSQPPGTPGSVLTKVHHTVTFSSQTPGTPGSVLSTVRHTVTFRSQPTGSVLSKVHHTVIMPLTSVVRQHCEIMASVWHCLSVCLSVHLSVTCLNLTQRIERPRKPKIGRMGARHTGNPWTYLEVKRSRSPGWLMLSQTMHHYTGQMEFLWCKGEN